MTFTAAELEAAILGGDENGDFDGWEDLDYAYGPNPDYDPEAMTEYERRRRAFINADNADPLTKERLKEEYYSYGAEAAGRLYASRRVPRTVTVNGETYEVKVVEDFGGMDQGSTRYVVFEVDGRLFRKDGFYASHYGTDWDGDFREVRKVVKEVAFYE